MIVGPNLTAEARVVLGADMITLSDGASVLPLEGIGELSARASRNGITGLSPIQVLTLVLVWLLAVSVPVVQQELPPEAQAIVSNENGMISLALAITLVIVSRKRCTANRLAGLCCLRVRTAHGCEAAAAAA
ncbi:MAG TPA: hypothetical protein VIV12_02510 [Streptosporangiaceae bacterium]